ncbi:MAG: hypothetical protein KJ709_00855 [Nanoarchaeota archaeon]|nr:hypothetical protein [Nanoarchaeota archaeon]
MRILILAIALLLLVPGCKNIGKEDAVAIAQNFTNNRVRFFTSDNESMQGVSEAVISMLDIENIENEWRVLMNVSSQNKTTGLIISIDDDTGEVIGVYSVNLTAPR